MCNFIKAWIGKCKEESILGTGYCSEHTGLVCVSCGSTATRECAETMGMVCGAILCDTCEHKIADNGCNSYNCGSKGHCKHDEQEHYSWLEKDEMTNAEKQLKARNISYQPGEKHLVNVFMGCGHNPDLPGIYEVTVNKNKLLRLGEKKATLVATS